MSDIPLSDSPRITVLCVFVPTHAIGFDRSLPRTFCGSLLSSISAAELIEDVLLAIQ